MASALEDNAGEFLCPGTREDVGSLVGARGDGVLPATGVAKEVQLPSDVCRSSAGV